MARSYHGQKSIPLLVYTSNITPLALFVFLQCLPPLSQFLTRFTVSLTFPGDHQIGSAALPNDSNFLSADLLNENPKSDEQVQSLKYPGFFFLLSSISICTGCFPSNDM